MDKDNPPWLYLAMVVIAFITWVFKRIQEATAARQRARELQRPQQERRPPWEDDDEEDPAVAPPPLPSARRRDTAPAGGEPAAMIRELVEALGGASTANRSPATSTPGQRRPEPVRAAKSSRTRIPQPPKTPSPDDLLSASERAVLERIRKHDGQTGDLFPSAARKRASRGHQPSSLRRLLGTPGGLRQAVVLKELLDKPVTMRESGGGF